MHPNQVTSKLRFLNWWWVEQKSYCSPLQCILLFYKTLCGKNILSMLWKRWMWDGKLILNKKNIKKVKLNSEERENNLVLKGFSSKYPCPLGMQYSLSVNFFQVSLSFWVPHFSLANTVQFIYCILWVTDFQRKVGVKDQATMKLSYIE